MRALHGLAATSRPGKVRIRQRDIVPFGAVALVLYPLGWALAHALVNGPFSGTNLHDLLQQTFQSASPASSACSA